MDGIKSYVFKWDNFHKILSYNFYSYLESGKFCDCSLSTEGQFIAAHKIILSACSPYFEQMFSFGNPQQSHMVILDQVAYEDLLSVLEFAYKGEATIKSVNYDRFLQAAKFLKLKGISCKEKFLPIVAPPTPPQESTLPDISMEKGILESFLSLETFVKPEPKSPIKLTKAKEMPVKKNPKRKAQSLGETSKAKSPKINDEADVKINVKRRRTSILTNTVNCKFCHNGYSKNSVNGHEKSCKQNPNRLIFQCTVCNKELSRQDKLNQHMKLHEK